MKERILKLLNVYSAVCLNYPLLDRGVILREIEALAGSLSTWVVRITVEEIERGTLPTKSGLYLLEEFPALLSGLQGWERGKVIQWLIDCLCERQPILMLNSQGISLPGHLQSLVPAIDWSLPNLGEIKQILGEALGNRELASDSLALAVSGLSSEEIRLGIQLVSSQDRTHESIKESLILYKQEQLKKLGLEFMSAPEISTFGGLARLKEAISQVALDYSPRARHSNIPLPKGWLLVGPPGTGKTFAAKVCAAYLGFPLISVGVDLVKSKGSTYLKQLLLRIESASPAVCYFDEFDKFFNPDTAISGGGQSKEVLGVLLTWLQEKLSQTFVIATLNRLDALPPELTRAGRFDRLFYVGFPQAIERKEILQLHAARFDSRYRDGDGPLSHREWRVLLSRTNNCTGAELRAVVENAAKANFYANREREGLDLEALLQARLRITPLYLRDTERILAMENRARFVSEPASDEDNSIFAPPDVDLWGEKAVFSSSP